MGLDRFQQVERLYHTALNLTPSRRVVFLQEACTGDEELHREVESLLGYQEKAERFIEMPAMEVAARALAGEQACAAAGRLPPAYRIDGLLGEGGMGVVYKARDTRLDRYVAVKVLPHHIADREDARARFEREARTVASLNHPNICTLHDIGPNYMVLELIEGETLAARIEKGPIPLEQAIALATQIADALDRAHRAGVTHRDIKPGNIMLTRDGPKVLDFGLAKSTAGHSPRDETLTHTVTAKGTVLGTPQYMAPEQFEGKEADARSDIWAFGAVLYEMVTGRKAFEGKSYSSLVGAILSADPAPVAVKPFTPAWLERLVRRCLEKDPDDRYHCMRDLVIDLKSPPEGIKVAPAKSGRLWQGVAAVLAIAAVTGWGRWAREGAGLLPPVATEILPPEGSMLANISNLGGSAISPDGRSVAFVAINEKGEWLLHIRPLESLTARALAGTEGAGRPFWSPDSKSLAYIAQGKLKRVDLAGGAPVTLCDAGSPRGGDWSDSGVVLFGTTAGERTGIQKTQASGGAPATVTRINTEAGETRHYYPVFLPGGREFLYLVHHTDPKKSGIAIGSLDGKADQTRPAEIGVQTHYWAAYDPASSVLLYMQEKGTLMARRLELHPARLVGDPVTVAAGIRTAYGNGYAEFSLSRRGTLFYAQGAGASRVRFAWRDRSGKTLETIGEPVEAGSTFALSPDGRLVAFSAATGSGQLEVWVMDLARGLSTRISFDGGQSPRWSPDGKVLYYNGATGIYRKSADGSGDEIRLARTRSMEYVSSVFPDGTRLLFGIRDIMALPLGVGGRGEAQPEGYLQTEHAERNGMFSPDGRWLAYNSNESGRDEIYIQGYPDKRGKWLVSASGGAFPAWRHDGKELFWAESNGTVMGSEIGLDKDGVRMGRPRPLFRLPVVITVPAFQPSGDGQRFLVFEPASAPSQRESMVVIQNWAARLEKMISWR